MRLWTIAFLVLFATPAAAVQLNFTGTIDVRLVFPSDTDRSWLQDGLGKLRFGAGDSTIQFAGAVGQASALITPELLATIVARVETEPKTTADLLETFVRYRPVSTTPWRWSLKLGAFFPPFSLENTEIGWAPYWTLTPSAINSWFGEEFRTIGAEVSLEWRTQQGTLILVAAGYGFNDPAGVLMADRGWTLNDRPTGLFEKPPLPDATLILFGRAHPDTTPMFLELDHTPGWYGGATWNDVRGFSVDIWRYDNEADPSAHKQDYFAWRTEFWNGGFSEQFDEFTILAQTISGSTKIAPFPSFSSTTSFDSVFGLLGWERDAWRVAARAEVFDTRTNTSSGAFSLTSEDGYAFTAATSWLPNDWLKLTAELLSVTSKRGERAVMDLAPTQTQTQVQLAARLYLN